MNASRLRRAASLALTALVLIGLIAAFTGASPWRPFDFADDMMWEYDPHIYFTDKMPAEARWLVLWWREGLGAWSRPADFMATLGFWCASATVMARAMVGEARPWLTAAAALALAACPPALNMLQWLHTSAPMMGVLFAAVLAAWLARRSVFALPVLALGAAATALSYQAFTILFAGWVAVVIVLEGLRDGTAPLRMLVRLAAAGAALGVGAVAGVLAGYGLNLHAFGHFGLKMDSWRTDSEPDRRRVAIILHSVQETLAFMTRQSLGIVPALAAAALAAVGVGAGRAAARGDRTTALRGALALVVLAAVAASSFLLPLVAGASIQKERNGMPFWMVIVAAVLAWLGTRRDRGRWGAAAGAMVLLGAAGVVSGAGPYVDFARYEAEDAAVLDRVAADYARVGPIKGSAMTFIVGTPPFRAWVNGLLRHPEPWWMQVLFDRMFALNHFTPAPQFCSGLKDADDDPCYDLLIPANLPRLTAMPAYPAPGYIQHWGNYAVIKLGPIPPVDAEDY